MRDLLAAARPARTYGRGPGATGTLIVWRDADGTEHTRTWPNALPGHRSPCRPDAAKGLHQHRCSVSHADAVRSYRLWRAHELDVAEDATGGYDTELAEYWRDHQRPTFKAYLIQMRDTTRDDAAA